MQPALKNISQRLRRGADEATSFFPFLIFSPKLFKSLSTSLLALPALVAFRMYSMNPETDILGKLILPLQRTGAAIYSHGLSRLSFGTKRSFHDG